jgi:preprotein translocase subunit Sec63
MANIVLSIPNDLQAEMRQFPKVKWDEVARKAIISRLDSLKSLERMNQIAKKSKLTQKDINELSRKINASANKKFLDEPRIKASFAKELKKKSKYIKLSDKELKKLMGL